MALVRCSECSKEVSDRAQSCPGCGAPVVSSRIILNLSGFPSDLRYVGTKPVDVYVAGKLIGTVNRGTSEKFEIESSCTVEFVTRLRAREKRASIEVKSGEAYDLGFDFGPLGKLQVNQRTSGGSTSFVGYTMDMPDFG